MFPGVKFDNNDSDYYDSSIDGVLFQAQPPETDHHKNVESDDNIENNDNFCTDKSDIEELDYLNQDDKLNIQFNVENELNIPFNVEEKFYDVETDEKIELNNLKIKIKQVKCGKCNEMRYRNNTFIIRHSLNEYICLECADSNNIREYIDWEEKPELKPAKKCSRCKKDKSTYRIIESTCNYCSNKQKLRYRCNKDSNNT